jgi:hypothetical protein
MGFNSWFGDFLPISRTPRVEKSSDPQNASLGANRMVVLHDPTIFESPHRQWRILGP